MADSKELLLSTDTDNWPIHQCISNIDGFLIGILIYLYIFDWYWYLVFDWKFYTRVETKMSLSCVIVFLTLSIDLLTLLKVWSHLSFLSEFLWVKSRHSKRNPCDPKSSISSKCCLFSSFKVTWILYAEQQKADGLCYWQ